MKRLAYICSWIILVLFILSGLSSFMVGTRSGAFALLPAVVFGIALIAFHAGRQRWVSGLAVAMNGLFALGACALVVLGINFSAGVGAFITAAALLVVVCGPALLNVVALLPSIRGTNAAEGARSASG
jgi:hypothetical protein